MASRREFVERACPSNPTGPPRDGREDLSAQSGASPVFLFGLLAANHRKTAHVLHAPEGAEGFLPPSCTISCLHALGARLR